METILIALLKTADKKITTPQDTVLILEGDILDDL
jgi:hypothetical protein